MEQQAQQHPEPTPEQIAKQAQLQALKNSMIETVQKAYTEFLGKVKVFPGAPLQHQQSMIRFDEGIYWLTLAIQHSQFEYRNLDTHDLEGNPLNKSDSVPQPPQADEPQAPSADETAPSSPAESPSCEPVGSEPVPVEQPVY